MIENWQKLPNGRLPVAMCPSLALTVFLSISSSYMDICGQFILNDHCVAV